MALVKGTEAARNTSSVYAAAIKEEELFRSSTRLEMLAVRTLGVWVTAILVSVASSQRRHHGSPCGSQAKLQVGESFSFQSPNFPRPYPSRAFCLWTAIAPANTILRLTCSRFSVMPSPGCRTDQFWVFPNWYFRREDGQYYCGTGVLDKVINSNRFAAVFFTEFKNYVSRYTGFTCTVKAIGKTVSSTAPPQTTRPNSNFKCGVKGASRIVGGQEAGENEWPWQAGLRHKRSNNIFCGAVVIDNQWLATAAHCVQKYDLRDIYVSLGGHKRNVNSPTKFSKDITIAEKIVHKNYVKETVDNDIALLRLSEPVEYSAGIKPICLPCQFTSTSFSGERGTVTGWGVTAFGGRQSDVLEEVELPILTTRECQKFFGKSVTNNMICTLKTGRDSCSGDSGGPLSWSRENRYHLVGLVSWGVGCAGEDSPGVYTKVTNYLPWIEKETSINFCSSKR